MSKIVNFIDNLLEFVQEESLDSVFARTKLYHKLQLVKIALPNSPFADAAIDYVCSAYSLTPTHLLKEESNLNTPETINLKDHYSLKERDAINAMFGFPLSNDSLNVEQLILAFQQNFNIKGAKEWYYRLLWSHFKSHATYNMPDINHMTNIGDEIIYVQTNKYDKDSDI